MLNHLVCGTFHPEEDELLFDSPRKSRKSKNKNPFSTRGLDKFSELLAELDRKRQEIYSQTRPQDISFIRFVSSHSSSNDIVPVVIKVKNKDQKHRNEELKGRHVTSKSQPLDESPAMEAPKQPQLGSDKNAEKKNFCGNLCRCPSLYLPLMLILILTLLTVFGRSVATICICILLYTVAAVKDSSLSRKSTKKKHYRRGLSEKTRAPESEDKPTRKFSRQRSW